MMQPLGNCPGCGGDEPFEQVHAGGECPDSGGECPEWMCLGCGAGVFLGTVIFAGSAADGGAGAAPARQSARAA